MFSLDDLRNITSGAPPTAAAIKAGRAAAAIATKGVAPMPSERATREGSPGYREDNLTEGAIQNELTRRLQRLQSAPPAAPLLSESVAPAQPAQPKGLPGLPPMGVTGSAHGIEGGYAAGGVPFEALGRFFPGKTVAPQVLRETHLPGVPAPGGRLPHPTPATPHLDEQALRQMVRQLLFEEVLEDNALLPLLEKMVKDSLRLIVREELERLQRGASKR